MNSNHRLVVLAFPAYGPDFNTAARTRNLENSFEMARWMDADVHILASDAEQGAIQDELSSLIAKKSLPHPAVVHSLPRYDAQEIAETAERLSAEIIAFEDGLERGPDSHPLLIDLKQAILERSSIPLLVFPRGSTLQSSAIASIMVPLSGERRKSDALSLALALAERTGSVVKLLHVNEQGRPCSCASAGLESIGDQVYHEYARLLDKVVSEGSPMSGIRERKRVTEFRHLFGDTPTEISRIMESQPGSILVLEWRGLLQGHANTIKTLLSSANYPVLIVRMARDARSRLRIGSDFEAA